MGLLDAIFPTDDASGLLGFLKRNAELQPMQSGLPSDQADYGAAPAASMTGVSPAMNANAQMPAPQSVQQQPPAVIRAPAAAPVAAPSITPQAPGTGSPGFMAGYENFRNGGGLLGSIVAGMTGQRNDPLGQAQQQAGQVANVTARALIQKGVDPQVAIAAVQPGNTEMLKQLVDTNLGPNTKTSIGDGYVVDKRGNVTRAYEPDDKTPQSVLEYQYYLKNVPKGQTPMDYATFSTQKARAGATLINNQVDMGNGQTYDKQLVGALGKSHAGLASGVEDAQGRARDIAAMQGALDAIQKNGGTTGGMGQAQILNLKKTINEGANALGIENPFSEGDISDKEFLTKFNRQMAGNMAKNAMGSRVTNFEMSNYLKANPGLDMSVTGNQRLLGIQAQIEQRNIAVGNAIRQATAQAIAAGKTINPVDVQKIITDYDDVHHVKDPITGQDLTQSYVLPEFQTTDINKSMAAGHAQNTKQLERTIGGKTYYQDANGDWRVKGSN